MKQLLDQVLNKSKDLMSQGGDKRKGQIQGALGGGALGLILGNKKIRKNGTKLAAVGGAAALGGIAYKLYSDWKVQQDNQETHIKYSDAPESGKTPGVSLDARSELVARAMIAAARADGHIDASEQQHILDYLNKQGQSDAAHYIEQELSRPLDPHLLAQEVTDMELATEVYFASLLAIDVDHFMEKSYLNELAMALGLDDSLKNRIERQVCELEKITPTVPTP